MTEIFVDTSYVVAYVSPDDAQHNEAVALARQYNGYLLLTTSAVLLEIGNFLARRRKPEAVKTIQSFFDSQEMRIVNVDEDLLREAFDLYAKYTDKTWGLVDCVSFIVMRREGVTDALTADVDFVQAGFNALLRN